MEVSGGHWHGDGDGNHAEGMTETRWVGARVVRVVALVFAFCMLTFGLLYGQYVWPRQHPLQGQHAEPGQHRLSLPPQIGWSRHKMGRRLSSAEGRKEVPGWGSTWVDRMGAWNFSYPKTGLDGYLIPKSGACHLHTAQHKGLSSSPPVFQECAQELYQVTVASRHRRKRICSPTLANDYPSSPRTLGSPQGEQVAPDPCSGPDCTQGSGSDPDAKLLWVTHLTSCNWQANRLAKAVTSCGIPFAAIGVGTAWNGDFGTRMRLLHDFLVTTPDDLLVVFTDYGDILPVPATTSAGIIDRYEMLASQYNRKVFFMASKVSWPLSELYYSYPRADEVTGSPDGSPFRCLNAGSLIGPAGFLRMILALIYQGDCWDDQHLYALAFLDPILWWTDKEDGRPRVGSKRQAAAGTIPDEATELVGLDYYTSLFVSLSYIKKSEVQVDEGNQTITFKPTKGRPLILHENGWRQNAVPLDHYSCAFGYHKAFMTQDDCNTTTSFSEK